MALTRSKIKKLQQEINDVAKKIAAKYNLKSNGSNAIWDETSFKLTLKFEGQDKDGNSKDVADFLRMADCFGFRKDSLGKSIDVNGEQMKVVGFAINSTKYPIIVESRNGKRYKVRLSTMTEQLGKEKLFNSITVKQL